METGIDDTGLAVTGVAEPAPGVDLAATQVPVGSRASGGVPGRLGRYTILERLGSGAMGVVFAAYDEILDRKVAVKVLHDAGTRAQSRLLREAQAMARVSHPNVVTVLEAGVAGRQVYVAMEFVRGVTLAAWLAAKPRSWQEVLDVFEQAGRGLAAAHAAGLVHRDFKPSNVMIDEAGRVRVLDFGLVRVAAPSQPSSASESASRSKLDVHLTHDDHIVGTPAYMAPEQWRGLSPEPASDQFSFCVALYEALYGASPFMEGGPAELVKRVLSGQAAEPPRRLGTPIWLAAVVMRGLKNGPKDRYPGMPALLAALDRRRARNWRRGAAALGLAGLATVAGVALAGPGSGDTCTGAPEQIARVWDAGRRDAVAAALKAAAPGYAAVLRPRVEGALDAYAAEWQEVHQEACRGHLRGERSGTLLDHQMRCLDRRLRELDETVASLASADAAVALRALEVTGELPALAGCRDLAALASARPPPDDPEVATQVAELRGRMSRAEVFARSGRLEDALALATGVVAAAERLADRPVLAEALLLRGRLGLNVSSGADDRIDRLTRAISAGFAARDDAVAAEATALRIFAMARESDLVDRALAEEPVALALAERSPTPEALRGLVLNNIGTAHLARQDQARAHRYFTEALALREAALGDGHREVGYTLVNLALASEPGPARHPLLARALAILEFELGPAHPETIEVRLIAAHLVAAEAAPGILRPGCAALDRFLAEDVVRRTRCLLHLGRLAVEIGDDDEAELAFLGAASLTGRAAAGSEALAEFEAAALAGYVALVQGEHEGAVQRIQATLATLPDEWWTRADAGELRLVLGQNLLAAGRAAEARTSLEASVTDYIALAASDPQLGPALARARRSLAEALFALGPGATRDAQTQLRAALEFYRGAGAGFARQLARTERIAARVAGPDGASGTKR